MMGTLATPLKQNIEDCRRHSDLIICTFSARQQFSPFIADACDMAREGSFSITVSSCCAGRL